MSGAACGTYSGYQRHRRLGELTCDACRKANREYQRQHRASRPDLRAVQQERHRARQRALWRLAREYPERYLRLTAEELANPSPVKEFVRDGAGQFATQAGAS